MIFSAVVGLAELAIGFIGGLGSIGTPMLGYSFLEFDPDDIRRRK